jgi:hypothetical protein
MQVKRTVAAEPVGNTPGVSEAPNTLRIVSH